LFVRFQNKKYFTKKRPLADELFYADIQMNGQTDINCYRHFSHFLSDVNKACIF